MTIDMPGSCSDKVMVFFIGFGLTKWCLISFQDHSCGWFIASGFTTVKLGHIMRDA